MPCRRAPLSPITYAPCIFDIPGISGVITPCPTPSRPAVMLACNFTWVGTCSPGLRQSEPGPRPPPLLGSGPLPPILLLYISAAATSSIGICKIKEHMPFTTGLCG